MTTRSGAEVGATPFTSTPQRCRRASGRRSRRAAAAPRRDPAPRNACGGARLSGARSVHGHAGEAGPHRRGRERDAYGRGPVTGRWSRSAATSGGELRRARRRCRRERPDDGVRRFGRRGARRRPRCSGWDRRAGARRSGPAGRHGTLRDVTKRPGPGAVLYPGFVGATSAESRAGARAARVCPDFHAAVELIGKRWTGAILWALTERPHYLRSSPSRYPVSRTDSCRAGFASSRQRAWWSAPSTRARPRGSLRADREGRALEPAIRQLRAWAKRWNGETSNGSRAGATDALRRATSP